VRANDDSFNITIGSVGDLSSTARLGSGLSPALISALSSGAGNATAQGASSVEGILGFYDTGTTSFSIVQPGAAQGDINSQASANIQLQATATSGVATATLSDAAGTGAAVVSGIRDMTLSLGSGLSSVNSSATSSYDLNARTVSDDANITASTITQGIISSDSATALPVSFAQNGSIAALANNITLARGSSVAGNASSSLQTGLLGLGNADVSIGGTGDVTINLLSRTNNQAQSVAGTT
jgi:hypothetical protein